ncbi:MAG TPA: restriction endonuclease subunit S [Hanamia sp.]|nr:restriction endonuclease subunit S [Hanamia sp.]
MSDWKEYKLGDVCSDINYGYTASANNNPIGPKFLRITDIVPERINWETVPYCEINKGNEKKYKLEKGDIVIARTGATTGYNAIIKGATHAVFASYLIRYRVKNEIANPFYIGYLLKSYEWKGFVQNVMSGSAQPGANAKQFADFDFELPPYQLQDEIVSILSSLDDKIDLLQRQNKTLEQLAETLFRQWFVEEAEESWEMVKVSDFAYINKLTVSRNYPFTVIEYLDTGSITEGVIENFETYNLSDAPSRAQRIVKDNDIVYSLVRPIQRHYGLLNNVKENTVVSTGFCVITSKRISQYFLYLLLTRNDAIDYFDMIAEGSTSAYPSLKPSDIAKFEFKKPPEEKLNKFNKVSSDTLNKIKSNTHQIKSLTQLRDALLPKLMSGEMRVKNNN